MNPKTPASNPAPPSPAPRSRARAASSESPTPCPPAPPTAQTADQTPPATRETAHPHIPPQLHRPPKPVRVRQQNRPLRPENRDRIHSHHAAETASQNSSPSHLPRRPQTPCSPPHGLASPRESSSPSSAYSQSPAPQSPPSPCPLIPPHRPQWSTKHVT